VTVNESSEDGLLSVERVKLLTGGDPITAHDKYKPMITFVPTHTIWLSTNHAPRVPDAGSAIWSRLLLIKWPVIIPEEDRIPDYGELLFHDEGPGILRWAVDGAVE